MRGNPLAKQLLQIAALALLAYLWLFPLIPLVLGSLRQVVGQVIASDSIQTWLINSFIVSITHTVIQLSLCIGAAYAIARLEFIGKRLVFTLILFGLLVPDIITLMPTFLLVRKLELANTYTALVLPNLASPLAVFLLIIFFRAVPFELQEAAFLDGANHFGFMMRIILPLSFPALVLVALFGFISNWNSLLWPSLVATDRDFWTVTVAADKANSYSAFSAALSAALPLMILFALFQHKVFDQMNQYSRK